jgi:glycosyltransferase involved in cell wall biosynthesis
LSANGRLNVLQLGKFYPPHRGGMETHLQTLSGELQKSLHLKVLVANDEWKSAHSTVDGVEVTRVGTAFTMAGAPICPQMAAQIRDARPDLVHLHLPNPTAVLAYLMSGHKGRIVATWHSDVIRQRTLAHLFRPLQRWVLKRCAALIATSPNYVANSSALGDYRDRCRIIPHGIPVERFRRFDSAAVEEIRGRYGSRIALYVGRLVYYKGIEHLIRAMTRVRGRLLILGDGPLRKNLQSDVRALGLEDRVVFLTGVADLVPYYQACDVFVLPSVARSEAFGIVQLEAMACGKPVVNTELASGVPFVSIDGVTGITVQPADPDALARAINRLLDDPVRATMYGRCGLRRVREEFSVERMASSTLALYEEVMSASVNGNGNVSVNGNGNGALNGKTHGAESVTRNGRPPMSATAA